MATIPRVGVEAPARSGWPLGQGLHHGSHPVVSRIVHASCWAVSAVTALDGVILSELRGTGVVSDRTEVTTVPSVLAGLVRHVY
jgi:hypothetical protein